MKPKTKLQKEVEGLRVKLPELTEVQKFWAVDHCFSRKAFLCKGFAWCSVCGRGYPTDVPELSTTVGVDTHINCPGCGARLKLEVSRKKKLHEQVYYQVVTTCGGWQVVRSFIASKYIEMGKAPVFSIREAVQNWINSEGHEEIVARPVNYSPSGCYDNWNFSKPMELRSKWRSHDCWNYQTDRYTISGAWVYPRRNLLPLLKRNGYTGRNNKMAENDHIRLLLTDREAEVLEKNGQFALLAHKAAHGIGEFKMHHAVKIAIRHGYKVRDASMWLDYLSLLKYFHKDTHNPTLVCQPNLKKEHDRLLRKKERAEAKRREEERIREAARWEEEYRKTKGRFFGICFGNDNIVVTVITSVADMAEEGKAMHHCVYGAGYYKRPDSLILSARDREGKRLETIEVNIKTFKVVQSRAKCNGTSEHHETILKLLDQNMNLIRRAAGAA